MRKVKAFQGSQATLITLPILRRPYATAEKIGHRKCPQRQCLSNLSRKGFPQALFFVEPEYSAVFAPDFSNRVAGSGGQYTPSYLFPSTDPRCQNRSSQNIMGGVAD
jgi:hypothetical protein